MKEKFTIKFFIKININKILYFKKTMSDNEEEIQSRKDFIESLSFDSLPLKKWLKDQCRLLGFEHPTPVQNACIPRILQGVHNIFCLVNIYLLKLFFFKRTRCFGMC